MLEKEIESILRKSHTDHFRWLERTLGTPFNKGLESWPSFVELTERRNLFVHTDGKISSQYLSVCKEHKCRLDDSMRIGTELDVSKSYFEDCYRCLYEIGVKLSHVVWRKLQKRDLSTIDKNLNNVTYTLIENREYAVAIRVLEFFTQPNVVHSSDAELRIMIINLAQAHKWSGQRQKCDEILALYDWSSSQDQFLLAVAVLKEDWESVYLIMRRLCHNSEFSKNHYRDWPLFKQLRKQQRFPEVYRECYAEVFSSPQAITSLQQEAKGGEDGEVHRQETQ